MADGWKRSRCPALPGRGRTQLRRPRRRQRQRSQAAKRRAGRGWRSCDPEFATGHAADSLALARCAVACSASRWRTGPVTATAGELEQFAVARHEQVGTAAGGDFHEFWSSPSRQRGMIGNRPAPRRRRRGSVRGCLLRAGTPELRIGEHALQLGGQPASVKQRTLAGFRSCHEGGTGRGSCQCSSSMTTLVSRTSFTRRGKP